MTDPKHKVSQSRRKFMRDAAITGGVAAAAVTAPGVAMAEATESPVNEKPDEGYRLTQHILDYYKSAAS